jgi:autotransporter-associated beta strand protein
MFNLGGGTLQATASFTVDNFLPITFTGIGGNGTIDTQSYAVEFDGNIAGPAGFTKMGSGTLKLTGANSYLGLTTVTGGILELGPNAQGPVLGSGAAGADIQSETAGLVFDYVSGSDPYATIKGLLNSQIYSSGAGVAPLICLDNTTLGTVTVEPTIPGDAVLDGKVDVNDLTIVLAHYNQTGMTWTQGEFTGDGRVDVNDLTIVLAHYNQTVGSSAGGVIKAVPEPCTLGLLAAGLAGLLAFAWRERK